MVGFGGVITSTMTRTRSGVSTNPSSPAEAAPPRRHDGAIEDDRFFDAPVEQQERELVPAGGEPPPANGREVSVGDRPVADAEAAAGTGSEGGGGEAADAEGAADPEAALADAEPAAGLGSTAEPAVGQPSTTPLAGEVDAEPAEGVREGEREGGAGSRGGRRMNPFRIDKVVNAPNSRFVLKAADISSLTPGYVVSAACVNVWMEAYLPELTCCLAVLEVRAASVFKDLAGREGNRWRSGLDTGLLTMSGEDWVPPEFGYTFIPVYMDE